jgi:hypothetical protein
MSFPNDNQGIVPDQFDPRNRGARPLFVFDLNPAPPQAVPAVGANGDGADARTPEAAKPTGACNYVPMPDNTGPTTHGGGDGKNGMAG